MHKTCTKCVRSLPLQQFNRAGKQGRSGVCVPCTNDMRRLRVPLPSIPRDPDEINWNNLTDLWFGFVRPNPRHVI